MTTDKGRGLLTGKKVLVTGAARGIGKAIAWEMAVEGADVAINYRSNEAEARSLAEEIRALGRNAVIVKGDVKEPSDVEAMIEKTVQELGAIDILVNNAGIRKDNLLMTMADDDWDAVLDTNLKGTYLCSKLVLRHMIRNHRGSIISIVSNSGVAGVMGQTNYSASKGGVIAFTKALSREVGRFGIRVNAVGPGLIETDMTEELDKEIKKEMTRQISLRRPGKPEEVAKAVVFLASDSASFITGQTLMVNGGDVL